MKSDPRIPLDTGYVGTCMFGSKRPDDFLDRLRKLGGEREVRQAEALARGMAFVDLDQVRSDPAARATISAALARELRVLPVKRDRKTLWVALADFDPAAMERVKEATGLRIVPVMCVPAELDAALADLEEMRHVDA